MAINGSVTSVDALRVAARSNQTSDNGLSTANATRQITTDAQDKQIQNSVQLSQNSTSPLATDSVRVSSTLGKAASSGLLTRDEAVAIYQKIASML